MKFIIIGILFFQEPKYYIFDPLNKGIEKLNVRLIEKISENLYLVEGEIKGDIHFYEIAPYLEEKKPKFNFYSLPDLRYNPIIDSFVQRVNVDSIYNFLYRMQNFRTRFSYADSCRKAEEWAYNKFSSWGYDTKFFPYSFQGNVWRNVVATKWGIDSNDIFCVIAHLDCTSENPYLLAPGADDNGSGSAVVLECARVLKDLNTHHTFRFILFTGEEQGLIGSSYYAEYADTIDMPLRAVLNYDMVGYTDDSNLDVSIMTNQYFPWLVDYQKAMADTYTNLIVYPSYSTSPGSDHWPFLARGFPTSWTIEYAGSHWYPYYHTTNDTVGNLNPDLMREVTKMTVASMAGFGIYPVSPRGIEVLDPGTGDSLVIRWLPNPEPDIIGYIIYMGISSGNYTDTFILGNVTEIGIGNLQEGTTYYFRLRAFNNYGIGFASKEFQGTPLSIPRKPFIRVEPDSFSIFVKFKNNELDISGYNLYKAIYPDTNFERILELTNDTIYYDFNVISGAKYWYYVEAIDIDSNVSVPSETLSAVPVTLDMGILIVDETRNGNGNPGFPNDEQVDAFYDSLISDIPHSKIDYDSLGGFNLSDFAPYEILIIHADDYLQQKANTYINDLYKYIQFGGKVIFSGWELIKGIVGNNYPYYFGQNHPINQIFGIKECYKSPNSDFIKGIGLFDYPDLYVNAQKLPSFANGRLYRVESYNLSNSLPIYLFDSYSNDPQFEGKPCASKKGNVIILGFPLYFIKTQNAKEFIHKALIDFGYIEAIEKEISKNKIFLQAISKKPFVEFSISKKEEVEIIIFDVSGRKIFYKKGNFETGNHKVDLKIEKSGVYFLKIKTKEFERLLKFIKI
ncbi:MAG: M20/M25/M40 family metallo-hydrolase [candidate division WOR-3 bacterium]